MFDDYIFSNPGTRKVDPPTYTISQNYKTMVDESNRIQEYLKITLKESMFLNWLMQEDITASTQIYMKLFTESLTSEDQQYHYPQSSLDKGRKFRNHSKKFHVKFPNKILIKKKSAQLMTAQKNTDPLMH